MAAPAKSPDRQLAAVVRRLVDALHPERIYLFGSRARGDARPESDYDLLVVVDRSSEPSHRRAQAGYRALRGIMLPLDLLVWTRSEFERQLPAAASLAATVCREGQLLYGG